MDFLVVAACVSLQRHSPLQANDPAVLLKDTDAEIVLGYQDSAPSDPLDSEIAELFFYLYEQYKDEDPQDLESGNPYIEAWMKGL